MDYTDKKGGHSNSTLLRISEQETQGRIKG